MSCSIFTKGLLEDADLSSASIDTAFLKKLMISKGEADEGKWYPLIIKPSDMAKDDAEFTRLLSPAGDDLTPTFDPCNCSNNIFGDGSGVLDIFNSQDFSSTPNIEIDCSYCSETCSHPSGSCSEESDCVTRFQKDDYIPKIPYLYEGYISGFNDFKNLKEFPSCSNVGLGKEKFIEMDLKSFNNTKLNIDLKLQETISEIEYDPFSTRHGTEYIHDKTLAKSKMTSQTCGAFVELSGSLPTSIIKPHGFTKDTYNNIYIGSQKIASHWKWNYQSGVLGWYRYYDENRVNDKRPMAGIDLYIAPGDVFFAQPDGPEYSNTDEEAEDDTACPSGLKIVRNGELHSIIPNDRNFLYLSENIYDRFLVCKEKLTDTLEDLSSEEIRKRAAIFATHPQYDDFITNLHSVAITENRDDFGQLLTLNKNMTIGTKFESAFNIYHCSTDEILIKTLAHKYGAYIFIEPNTLKTITPEGDSSNSYSIDLSFDMVIPKKKLKFNTTNGAMLPDQPNYRRDFRYEQKFIVGDETIVKTLHNSRMGFDETCDEGTYEEENHVNYSSLYFHNKTVASVINNSGSYYLENKYSNKQPDKIRKYPAKAFNPHVDLVAAHKQGGIYANSLPFNLKQGTFFIDGVNESRQGEIGIVFDTKDCGIKIYDITIKKLQTNLTASAGCERFPYSIDNTCNCYGFGIADVDSSQRRQFYSNSNAKTLYSAYKYTPSLSTKNSPLLKRYGGYDQGTLDRLFGAGEVTATTSTISQLNYHIEDPLAPYGTEKQDSITLPNYVNTFWKLKLKNLGSNNNSHLDTIVTVNENVNLTANRFTGDPSDPEWTSNHNMSWKKFTTKVKIVGNELYNEQQASIRVSDNTDISISLHNPFLTKLLSDDESTVFGSPNNSDNLLSNSPTLYSTRGDESSAVTLTFTRKPRKQLLNFYIPPPKSYGQLTKSIYDPNKGLRTGSNTNSPFYKDRPYYEHSFYDDPEWEKNRGIVRGVIDDTFRTLANQVDDFSIGRKLKLYVKSGSTWYTIGADKTFSYEVNDKLYIGKPKLFEYLAYTNNSQRIPMFYPISPKKLFKWNFYLNHARPNNRSYSTSLPATYPQINGREAIFPINKKFTNKLKFAGTRYYFLVDEELTIVKPQKLAKDEDGNVIVNDDDEPQFEDVTDIKDVEDIANDYPGGSIVDFGGAKYYFKGGDETDVDNYIFVGSQYRRVLRTGNSLDLKYDDITTHGYIYNTRKKCDHAIRLYKQNGGIVSLDTSVKIVRKELIVEGFNQDGKPALRDITEHNVYTEFTLDKSIEIEKFFSVDIPDLNKGTSLVIYAEKDTDDKSEYLRLAGDKRTKWADVDGYENTPLLDLILNANKNVTDWYGTSPYNNYFYKEMVNNFDSTHTFKLYDEGEEFTKIINTEDVLFCILQKYNVNINPERVNLLNAMDYQNFIPMMDITFPKNKSVIQAAFPFPNTLYTFESVENKTSIGLPIRGFIESPNWTYEHDDYKNDGYIIPPDSSDATASTINTFWMNVDEDDLVEAAYVPPTAGVYSDTLRLDDPLFWLDSTTRKTTRSTDRVRTTFTPTSNTLARQTYRIPGYGSKVEERDYAFSIQNIYGDGDDKSECGAQGMTDCFTTTRGSVSLHAKLKIARNPTNSSTIPDGSFFVTYDAGQYNPVGQKNLITIARSELQTDNPIDSSLDFCDTAYIRPDYKRTVYDPERKNVLVEGLDVSHSTDIQNLDKYANEILFRILYGEDQIVNRNILNSKNKPLDVDQLVNFTDPKITAADIYDEILYNYDTSTDCGCTQGSFSVTGPRKNGTNYSFLVGSKDISFSITQEGGTLKAVGTIGSKSFNVQLVSTQTIKTGVTVTEIGTTPQNTDTTTYTFQKQTNGYTSKYYGSSSGRIYTGTCAYAIRGSLLSVIYGAPNIHLGLNPANPTHAGRIPAGLSAITISNCGGSGPQSCGGNPTPIVVGEPCSYTTEEPCPDRSCDDYEYGYCRRKEGCNTAECDGDEEMENFLYSFQQCRTTFNVYGHKYRIGTGERDSGTFVENPTEETAPETTAEQFQERFSSDEDEDKYEGLEVFEPYIVDDYIQLTDPDPDNNYSSVHCGRRVIDGNIPVKNYPYTGPYVQNWRKKSPWYRGAAQSRCGAGNGVVGGDLSLSMHCGPADPIICNPWSVYTTSLSQGGGEGAILAYQYQKMRRPCDGTSDNPLAGEPGYDLCGLANSTVVVPGKKYYTYKTITSTDLNISECPQHVCSISYNAHSVTLNIGGETFCEETTTQYGCLDMSATLPAHAYISSENISNDCSTQKRGQVILEETKQNFKTVRLRKKYYMGTMSGGDANPVAAISTFKSANCGLFSSFTYCHGSSAAQCGNNSAYWIALEGWDSRGTFAPAYARWKERMIEGFSNLNQEIGAEVGWYAYARNGRSDNSGAQRARDVCNANNHISASDIVQGIVPGTCSAVQFETTTEELPKVRVANGGGVESSTYTFYTSKAYIEYDYIRPVTIQDVLKGWTEGGTVPCEESRGNSSTYDEFPEWYAQSLGLSTRDTLFYPIQNYGRTGNYIRRKQTVSKKTYCGDSLTSYVPDDYNKDGDSNYPYGGAPCGRNDYNCWSRNRDWITVWLE